jgi:hypothetical protein
MANNNDTTNNNTTNNENIFNDNIYDIYQELINKYIEYYKKTYPEKNIKNMFQDINFDDQTSTNHIMEMFYFEMLKYNKTDNNIYHSIDDLNNISDTKTELYGLQINNKDIKCVSNSIISLLIEVINNNYKDWVLINLI